MAPTAASSAHPGFVDVDIRHARCFTYQRFDDHAVLEVRSPWKESVASFRYYLLPHGAAVPEGLAGESIVRVPVQSLASFSTTDVGFLEKVGALDRLIGFSDPRLLTSAAAWKRVDSGELVTIGDGTDPNVERILDLAPEVLLTYGLTDADMDRYRVFRESGIATVVTASWMETTPLGYAEWLKFIGVLVGRETQAEEAFAGIEQRYQTLRQRVESATTQRPKVFLGTSYRGTWFMPAGQSYLSAYLRDAGAEFPWSNVAEMGTLRLDFESVLHAAGDADFWLNTGQWRDLDEALAEDSRYQDFAAFARRTVYNNNGRLGPQGGNDFYESGLVNPDRILADLVRIFHPELLPDHQLVWYRPLKLQSDAK